MTIKEILEEMIKDIGYPITPEKIKKAGHNEEEYMQEIKAKIETADDYESNKNQKLIKKFFSVVNEL